MDYSTIEVQTPRGEAVTLFHREGYTDLSTIGAIFNLWGTLHDEYGLAALHPSTFLDIGGHIGAVTIAVLVDNPECRAVIVEPLPENLAIIEANLEATGVRHRATVVSGAIGKGKEQRVGYTLARVENADDIHRYVGSPVGRDYAGQAITSKVYRLGDLLDMLNPNGRIDLAKIDCEGCEWIALADKAASRVDLWRGEYHAGDPEQLVAMLPGHDVIYEAHDHGATGMFTAVTR